MKVLIVVHGFPPSAQGGSEIYAETHARILSEQYGDDVLVVTRESDPSAAEYRVRSEDRGGFRVIWINNTFRAARSFFETYANDAIGEIGSGLLDEFEPDVAHVHHLTCLSTTLVEALARRAVPCFFTLHDYWLLCHRGQLLDRSLRLCPGPEPDGCDLCLDEAAGVSPLGFSAAAALRTAERWLPTAAIRAARRVGGRVAGATTPSTVAATEAARRLDHMRQVASHVTHFLTPSRYVRERFIEFGIAPERITHAPIGVDHRPFRHTPHTRSSHLRLGFLGSLMVSKAPHLLLEAFRKLEPGTATVELFGAHVDYHGDDSYRHTLAPLLEQRGVRLHEPVPHDQVPETLGSLDALVVPSVWPENSPLVVLEAFLAGLPVVAARIGGIPELVSDGTNGLLFHAGDADDLARALARLVNEPELLPTLRRGIPSVRTIDDDIGATRRLYEKQLAAATIPGSRDSPVESRGAPVESRGAPGESPDSRSAVVTFAAVVLNYGTPDDTVLTVRSLLASRRPFDQIVVVDNDGTDGCRQAIASIENIASQVTYIRTERNLGFSGGMNVGIQRALADGADRVLLVNSDVFVPPDCLQELEGSLASAPAAEIAGPVLRSRSEPDRVASLGMSYHPSTGRMRHAGFGTTSAGGFNGDSAFADTTVDAVSGCVMLVTRAVFERIGLLDDDYFFSFEDLDFCLRARKAGFETVLSGRASVYHEGGRSVRSTSVDRLYYATRNHLLAARRTTADPGRVGSALRGISIVGLNLAYVFRFRGGSLGSRLAAVAAGTRDYVRGRFGPRGQA